MKYILLLLIALMSSSLGVGQNTFIKKINKGENRLARQVVLYENRVFVLITGICENQYECSLFMEIDEHGNVLWEESKKWLDVSTNSMVIKNDTIFISGNYPGLDRYYWHQMFVNGGDSLATYEIVGNVGDYKEMFNHGTVVFGDQFCIYGTGEVANDDESSLLYFVDQQGKIDTLVKLVTTGVDADPWEVIPDNEGNLVAFIRYREDGKDRQRMVAKIDASKNIVWSYLSEENNQNTAIPNGAVLKDDRIVYNTGDVTNDDIHFLRAINPDSTIAWTYESPVNNSSGREFLKIQTVSDGSILGTGRWADLPNIPRFLGAPWINKISTDGELLWEHVYYDLEDDGDAQYGSFRDAVELEDGSFIVVGHIDRGPLDPREILIARLDADGCLTPDCPLLNDVSDLLSSTNDVPFEDFVIYPNPVRDMINIRMDSSPSKIEICKSDGRVVRTEKGSTQIDTSGLGPGLYWIKVYTNDKRGVRSFVKE